MKSGPKRVELAAPALLSDYPCGISFTSAVPLPTAQKYFSVLPINIYVVNKLLAIPAVFSDEATLSKWDEHLGLADLKL